MVLKLKGGNGGDYHGSLYRRDNLDAPFVVVILSWLYSKVKENENIEWRVIK